MSVEPNDTFTLFAFPVSILSSDGAFCWSRSSVEPSHRVCAPSEVPKTLRRAAMIKTSESFCGFLECPRNRIKQPSPDRGLRGATAKRGTEGRCSSALPRSTQNRDTDEGSGSANGEGKLAVVNMSGERTMGTSASFEVRGARSPSDPTHQTQERLSCDAGRTLPLGPYFLKQLSGEAPGNRPR
jgi:hypothetical protein